MGSLKIKGLFVFPNFEAAKRLFAKVLFTTAKKNGNLASYSFMRLLNGKAGMQPCHYQEQERKESWCITALPGMLAGSLVCTSSPGPFQEISRGGTWVSTRENNTKQIMSRNCPQPATNRGRGNRNFIKGFFSQQWRSRGNPQVFNFLFINCLDGFWFAGWVPSSAGKCKTDGLWAAWTEQGSPSSNSADKGPFTSWTLDHRTLSI